MKIVNWVVCILFGLMFINSGLNKLFNYLPMPEMTSSQLELFAAFGKISWLMPLVAVVEIIGGIFSIIPRFRALGAIIILPVMVGIVIHHFVFEPSTIIIALVLFAINIWLIVLNWKKYQALIQ